jgi:hypothetical protein
MYASARQRTETRGMHKHEDFASLDVAQQRCVLTGGLDTLWVRPHAGWPSTVAHWKEGWFSMRSSLQRTAILLVVPVLSVAWLLGACDTDVTIPPPPPDASAVKDAAGDAPPPDGSVAEAGPETDAEADGEVTGDAAPDSEAADAAREAGDAGVEASIDAALDAPGE